MKYIILFSFFYLFNLTYANAGIYLKIENNCPFSIYAKVEDTNDKTYNYDYKEVKSGESKKHYFFTSDGDTFNVSLFRTSDISDSFAKGHFRLSDNFNNNEFRGYSEKKEYFYIENDLSRGENLFSWHNISGTPTKSVYACSRKKIQFSSIKSFGLGKVYVYDQNNNIVNNSLISDTIPYTFRFTNLNVTCHFNPSPTNNDNRLTCTGFQIFAQYNTDKKQFRFFCQQSNSNSSKCPWVVAKKSVSNHFSNVNIFG